MNHTYKVPIIPQNLNKQETIIQIAEVLDHLSAVTEDMLGHISKRIDSSNSKMLNISERVAKVNSKITKLSGAKNASQVFSSCKYPAVDANEPYISIFSEVKPLELIRHKVKHKKLITNDEPLDKLFVYHVKTKNGGHPENVNGLGEIPTNIECVNDLLLYNSGKNLYTNFVMSDALDVSQQTREREINDKSGIGVAPHSISERSTLTRSSTQTFFYSPNLGEVPALDVPLDLPDLPGIADDLRYDTELGPGIAPSVTTTPNIPDLPVIEHVEIAAKEESIPEIELPPPPPPMEAILIKIEPQPVTPFIETPVEVENQPPAPKLPEVSQSDGHASLMEAIRKAGGSRNAKLKSAEYDKKEPQKQTGGDLMADLHAKLSMRRKGISGTKKQENGLDAGSAMEKISAMIPPPIVNIELNDTNTEDEDWDD